MVLIVHLCGCLCGRLCTHLSVHVSHVCFSVCRRHCYLKAMVRMSYQWELVDRWALHLALS